MEPQLTSTALNLTNGESESRIYAAFAPIRPSLSPVSRLSTWQMKLLSQAAPAEELVAAPATAGQSSHPPPMRGLGRLGPPSTRKIFKPSKLKPTLECCELSEPRRNTSLRYPFVLRYFLYSHITGRTSIVREQFVGAKFTCLCI